ncbi:lysine transporter LysE [Pseudomonas putida]|uniref:Lysine transporter LysE n=1 Tax=Pseudomonas putida TaxID=303 RepID=A0A2S3X7K5_PSEPU|nr:LysE family translocator [Pseudomonas putida]POG11581.1 lysine transporter LysE [Pseudomonas putida]POG16787.1 lysine transporter LysE [Pseudomonas putida]
MIDLPMLLAFIAAASVLAVTPGVDTAMVLRAAAVDGRRTALLAAVGVALGCLAWGGAVSLGLGVLLQRSEVAYTVLKSAGAAYLLWVGIKLLLKPRQSFQNKLEGDNTVSGWSAFARGLLTNLLNPKVGIFYVTLLPQFIPAGVALSMYSFFLASIHVLLTVVWFGLLIAATMPLKNLLSQPSTVKALDRVTGGIFIAFGLKIAASSAR